MPLLLESTCLVRSILSQCSSTTSSARVSCLVRSICLSVLPLPILLEYLCLVRSIPYQCTPTASSARVFMSCTFHSVSVYSYCLFCLSLHVFYVLFYLSVLPLPLLLEYLCLVRSIPSQCSSTASSARVFITRTFYYVSVYSHSLFCSSIHLARFILSQCTPTPSSARVFITRTFYYVSVYSHSLFCSSIHNSHVLFCLSVLPLPLLLEYSYLVPSILSQCSSTASSARVSCLVRSILSKCSSTAYSARVFMSCTFYSISVYSHCLFCSSIYVLYVLSRLNVLPLPLLLEYLCLVRSIPSQCSSTTSSARVFMSCTFYPVSMFFHCFFCSSIYVLHVLSCLSVLPLLLLLESTCLVSSIPSQCSSTASSARVFMSCTFYPVLVFVHCFFCSSLYVL